ncbi:diphthamide synthesis protein [Candidatus Woesearchaeota archaeon]|nr:diphthamide synthesis protein [Candidatus Woesearchaeota archaeon]
MSYNLEIGRAVSKIKEKRAKRVCIQLPDGLKPKAKEIQEAIEKKTSAQVFIWAGSCFGACDIPAELKNLEIDLLIQWGHTAWR